MSLPRRHAIIRVHTAMQSHDDIRQQATRFLAAGMANVFVDLGVYSSMLAAGAPIWISKGVAFLAGTVFAFLVNKRWTFRQPAGGWGQFAAVLLLYGSSMAINVALNSFVIGVMPPGLLGKAVAYCAAVGASAILNFSGMRLIFARIRT